MGRLLADDGKGRQCGRNAARPQSPRRQRAGAGSAGVRHAACGTWRRRPRRVAYFFLGAAAFASSAFGASPITDLSGHTEKAGHFLQPTTIAIGQSVMVMSPRWVRGSGYTARAGEPAAAPPGQDIGNVTACDATRRARTPAWAGLPCGPSVAAPKTASSGATGAGCRRGPRAWAPA